MSRIIPIPIAHGQADLDIQQGLLVFRNSDGVEYYRFKLSGHLECSRHPDGGGSAELKLLSEQVGHWVFLCDDGLIQKHIHVQVRGEFIDYWITARSVGGPVGVLWMHYGQDAPGHQNASMHALEEFFVLCPDRYGSLIPRTDKMSVRLGVLSFRYERDNNFPHDAGRAIIAPYVAALRSGQDWLAVGTMELPTCEYGLNMTFQAGKVSTDFYYAGNLTVEDEFAFPRITFFVESDKVAAVRRYVQRLYDDGLAVHNDQWDADWSGPIYCFFSDQMYEYQVDRSTDQMLGEMTMTENYCNERFMDECLDFLANHAIDYKIIILDYGWFICNGMWREHPQRFGGLKASIKRLQKMGKKFLLWYSPYFIAEQSDHYRNHPEVVVRKQNGEQMFVTRFSIEVNYLSDFTHPTMRELVRRDIEYMLSPAGLDADGMKVDCTHQPPTINNAFYDPSWGTGELFHYKASKFLYDTAKQIKPGCCINSTAANPFFNRTYDLHRLHDGLEYNLDSYEERAWAACLCQAGVSDLDDWPSCDLYTTRANLRKIIYGSPSLYAVRRRGGERKSQSSYGYSITVRPDELELLSSIYRLMTLMPIRADQQITIDPFEKIFSRIYTTGPLKDFYAAVTLGGNQAAAIYTPTHALVVSLSDLALAVPLPKGAGSSGSSIKLLRVMRDGSNEPQPCEIHNGLAVFNARRCSGPTWGYRIEYRLGGS